MEMPTMGQQGWICPKCGRVLAPWVSECPCYRSIHTPASIDSTKPIPNSIPRGVSTGSSEQSPWLYTPRVTSMRPVMNLGGKENAKVME